jgi:hypothetical protein
LVAVVVEPKRYNQVVLEVRVEVHQALVLLAQFLLHLEHLVKVITVVLPQEVLVHIKVVVVVAQVL